MANDPIRVVSMGTHIPVFSHLGSNIEETVMNKVTPERIVSPPRAFYQDKLPLSWSYVENVP